MKNYIIDTNALISFVTDRNPKQQQIMKSIFESASLLKGMILCHHHVLTEFVYVMDKVYQVPKDEIKGMVKDFMLLPGINVIRDIHFKTVFFFWPEFIADFGDAIVAALCKAHKGSIIVTFDQKLIRQIKTVGLTAYS
jgi:predicted nucleic acid-binding protein